MLNPSPSARFLHGDNMTDRPANHIPAVRVESVNARIRPAFLDLTMARLTQRGLSGSWIRWDNTGMIQIFYGNGVTFYRIFNNFYAERFS